MARERDRRKAGARGRKAGGGQRGAAGRGVAKAGPAKRPGAKRAAESRGLPTPGAGGKLPRPKFKGKLLEHEPLARYTTYRIGGPARYLVQAADVEDVQLALELARRDGLPWVALGLGSNVLVADHGFPGVVVRIGKGLDHFEMKGRTAIVGAGLPTPLLARRTAEAGFSGVERFVGVPGTVGGGVYMNAGCHGAEFAEVLTEVTVLDDGGRLRTIPRKQIRFQYRASNLGRVVVLEARLLLGEEAPAQLKELQGRLFRWRKAGTPFDQPCCGSTFKNPGGAKTAGTLIEEVGLKGHRVGGVQVSSLHANYFVNTGTATAADVLKLIDHVRSTVRRKTGVELEPEVHVIGA